MNELLTELKASRQALAEANAALDEAIGIRKDARDRFYAAAQAVKDALALLVVEPDQTTP